MPLYKDDAEYGKLRMVHAVVDMYEIYGSGPGQKSVKIGLLGMDVENDLGYPGEEDIENSVLVDCQGNFRGFPGLPDEINKQLIGEGRRYSNSMMQPPLRRLPTTRDLPKPLPVARRKSPTIVRTPPVEPYESPAERRARLLEEERKTKEKAEKKRVKKQKQKERRQLERLEKGKQNPEKSTDVKDDSRQSKAEDGKRVNDKSSKNNSGPRETTTPGKRNASRDTDSSDSSDEYYSDEEGSDQESEPTDEELDLTSTFVSKAATIVARQLALEQKAKSEKREKKKNPVKEETQPPPDKTNEEEEDDKKETTAAPSNPPSLDDYIKRSTEMALLGNRFASAGQFDEAVKYFTNAIKYNPREFRLFGNRAFCFEKMLEYEKSLTDAELSLNMCPGWVKGLFRKGRALAGLQRYREAAQAFKEVLKLDSSCTDAAQELMRVQITELMAYGFSREQSSNALIIHGTVDKSLEVLSKLNGDPGSIYRGSRPGPVPRQPVENMAPVPTAASKHYPPPQAHNAPRPPLQNRLKGPAQNMSYVQSHPKTYYEPAMNAESPDPEQALFPIWVGNLVPTVTDAMITDLFSSVGELHSVKLLCARRCAFVNYTNQDHCDDAILQFHGHELMGVRITVRYPDRIPKGLGMSKAALKAVDLPEDNPNQKECFFWRNMGCTRRPACPYRHILEHKGIDHQRNKPRHKAPGTRLSQE